MGNRRATSRRDRYRYAGRIAAGALVLLLTPVSWACESGPVPDAGEARAGQYEFTNWPGPGIEVHYHAPADSGPESPILIVVPGARRNADEYLQHWMGLADEHHFVVASIGADLERFPTEYDYNAGGVLTSRGEQRSEEEWLFSAIELIFTNLKGRLGLRQRQYSLYGHSAGGGFVHRFMLFKNSGLVARAVAANPAFVTLPDEGELYPFGLAGTTVSSDQLVRWFGAPLTILLGDQDLGPRTKPLSNSESARQQGPNVYSRGQLLYRRASELARQTNTNFAWRLHVVEGVGHDGALMTPHAMPFLFVTPDREGG